MDVAKETLPWTSNLYNTSYTLWWWAGTPGLQPLQHPEHWQKQLTLLHIKYHRLTLSFN